jgi:hypothetical protein
VTKIKLLHCAAGNFLKIFSFLSLQIGAIALQLRNKVARGGVYCVAETICRLSTEGTEETRRNYCYFVTLDRAPELSSDLGHNSACGTAFCRIGQH